MRGADDTVEVRPARVEDIFELRHAILRPHLPRETAVYDVDSWPETRHFAAWDDGRVVGTVTIFPMALDERETNAWQLRGMAVADAARGLGVGRKLLAAVDEHLRRLAPPTPLLWCNARVTAIGFYQRCGWEVISDVYDVPTVGPHVKMIKRL